MAPSHRFPPLASDFTLREPPESLWTRGAAVGRFVAPVARPNVEAGPVRAPLKQWHYQSFTTKTWFLAFGLVQLGYVAQLFVYLVDLRSGERVELTRMSLLGRALRFAPSSIAGKTTWRTSGVSVETGFDGQHFVRLDLLLGGKRLSGELRSEPDEALALSFPLAPERLAYTHKAAAMRTRGTLRFGDLSLSFEEALSGLDFTRSLALRHTVWNWASFAGTTASGKRMGLNLSARVYDLAGQSMENAVWLDGRVQTLGGVHFEVPRHTATETWRIRSLDGSGEVALDIQPLGERSAALDLKLIRSVFVQPYGEASGVVMGERIEGVFGVVEDHDALW